jgi:hypothetical protein
MLKNCSCNDKRAFAHRTIYVCPVLWVFLFSLLLQTVVEAQNHDYIWYYGYHNDEEYPLFHGGQVSFHTNPPTASPNLRPVNIGMYGHTMADSSGTKVLYYSNGLHIYNREDEIMLNGDTINYNTWWEMVHPRPLISYLSGLSIPYPGRQNEYLYFHQPIDFNGSITIPLPVDGVLYTHIDMGGDSGLGEVISKNNELFEGYSSPLGLTKTADNSGWWLVHGTYADSVYYTYLVDSLGVHLTSVDTLPAEFYNLVDPPVFNEYRQAGFSPDGSKFAVFDNMHGIVLLDFDRCAGVLSNARFYDIDGASASSSLVFSPNSRFIYHNNSGQLIQLDTRLAPNENPMDTIANWDLYYFNNQFPFGNSFGAGTLAPDGKIYYALTNTSKHFHVVERPNLPGQACGVRQYGFELPTVNGRTIPYAPNYRLEPIDCE